MLLDISNKQIKQKITLDEINSSFTLDEYGCIQGTFACPEDDLINRKTVPEFDDFDNLKPQKSYVLKCRESANLDMIIAEFQRLEINFKSS